MKINTKQIALTGLLLAICIGSQFFKNLSVYITGPIINAALILTTIYCGLACGIILSIITPVTAFFITGSPVMSAIPALIPSVMLGNVVLVVVVWLFSKKTDNKLINGAGMVVGSIVKAAVMGGLIALYILPKFLPEKMIKKLPVLQIQFSLTQLITALIGSVFAFIILQVLRKSVFTK